MSEHKLPEQTKCLWQTKARGNNETEYQLYLAHGNDGKGLDITTGRPLKSYQQWLGS
jgi:hypothetical protein